MWNGDFGNAKKVDFGGGGRQHDRKRQLEEVRKQREQRRLQNKKEDAARTVQRVTRSYICRKHSKQELRETWDVDISKAKKRCTPQQLTNLVRSFLFFYDERNDASQLEALCKLLITSMRSQDSGNDYRSLLISTDTCDGWLFQAKKLAEILLQDLSVLPKATTSKLTRTTALWLLLDYNSWKLVKTVPQKSKTHLKLCSSKLITHLLDFGDGLYSYLRCAILGRMYLFRDKSQSQIHIKTHKTTLGLLFAMAIRPLSVVEPVHMMEIEEKTFNSNAQSSSSSKPQGSSDSKKRKMFSQQCQSARRNVSSCFVSQILTIPLFVERLKFYDLEALVRSVTYDAHWGKLLKSIVENESIIATDMPESSSSHSWFDNEMVPELKSPKRMLDIDEDSDDEFSEKKRPDSHQVLAKPSPISCHAWLLGNVLELEHIAKNSTTAHFTAHIAALTQLLSKVSPRVFPKQGGSPHLHPLYIAQLDLFTNQEFLSRICSELVRNSGDLDQIYTLCLIIVTLLHKCPSLESQILNKLVYSTDLIPRLWESLNASEHFTELHEKPCDSIGVPFSLFCVCYSHLLKIQDDDEFYVQTMPFELSTVTHIAHYMRQLLFRLFWKAPEYPEVEVNKHLKGVVCRTFKQLRHRQSRRRFCHPDVWLMPEISGDVLQREVANQIGRSVAVVREIPFVLPFDERVRLFYNFIESDKEELESDPYYNISFAAGHGHRATIRRDRVLEDGYAHLNGLGPKLRGLVQIEFVDAHGIPERGIDGGGLFKEFLTSLSLTAYDPNYGLFKETPDHFLYPNPGADIHEAYIGYMEFLGRVLGKAMYEGILIEPKFANFFLHKILGTYNYIDDLASLDEEFYKHLMFLKKYDGDVKDLAITFSTSDEKFGQKIEVDLINNGSNISVTNSNKLRYIHLVADFKLNKQLQKQMNAFLRGLSDLMKPEWIRMFSADEIQQLISGSDKINIDDWKNNTHYSGGFNHQHELVLWFWEIVHEMTEEQRALLLKFCTSCSRAPLLGFKEIKPKFCINRVSGASEDLPSASTCMNLFKIPRYLSKEKLKTKLLYAIQASEGFHMT